MRFDLAQMIRQTRNPRRKQIEVRPIEPTAAMAADLYARVYKPVITAWQQAVERIARSYEGALPVVDSLRDTTELVSREGARDVTQNLTDSIFDLDSILGSIGDELQRLVIAITPSLREWSLRTEGWHRGKWRGVVLTATGIDMQTVLSPHDVDDDLGAFVARNVGLVRSVSDEARTRIGDIVFRGYQARTPAAQVAREMRESVDLSRKRALRIAADQSKKLSARLDQARQEQAGITSFKWRHSLKKHPRAVHVAHDGKIYRWDALPLLDGKPDRPGDLPFCGCRAQAVIDLS